MKKAVFITLITFFVFFAMSEEKPRYSWPLSFDNGVSSSFMEFRANHFHAGFDLRTYQMIGFPVLAIADGAIVRIRVIKNDTGRALYLRHIDGNMSIYFHLDRFNEELEALVKKLQSERRQKYFGQYDLENPLPVSRGDCIAFSGETGIGFPHLHVEIRNPQDQALNPFPMCAFPRSDQNPPHALSILFRTKGASLIDGECGEILFPLVFHEGQYTVSHLFEVQGAFEASLQAYDLSDVGKYVSLYSLRAYLDQELVYDLRMDRFGRNDNFQLGMVYDLFRSNNGIFFFNLSWQPGFDLEASKALFSLKVAALSEGRHVLRIVISDQFFNEREVWVPFLKVTRCSNVPDDFADNRSSTHELRKIRPEFHFFGDDIVARLPGIQWPLSQVRLLVSQGNREQPVNARPMNQGLFFSFKPLNREPQMLLRFQFMKENQVMAEIQEALILAMLFPDSQSSVSAGEWRIDFKEKSVKEPKVLRVVRADMPSSIRPFPLLSDPLDIFPYAVPFLDDVLVRYRMPGKVENPRQVGLFKYNFHHRSWRYMNTGFDGSTFFTRLSNPGMLVVMRDIYPPEIRLLSRRRQSLASCRQLIVRIRDHGKGIDENTLKVTLNDVTLDAEYDPDWNWVKIKDPQPLHTGENVLWVEVADLAGNTVSRRFRIVLR